MGTAVLAPTGRLGRRSFLGRHLARRPAALDVIAAVVVALALLCAAFGPLIVPAGTDSSHILDALLHPSSAHWFGTDQQGRDVFWRVVEGARVTIPSALIVVAGYSLIGVLIASAASAFPWVDSVLMRITDAGLAMPPIIFALGLAAALGPSLRSAIIAMIVTGWPYTARLLRTVMRDTMVQPYVEGATILGVSRTRLMFRHVLPNSLDVLIVKWAGDIGNTVLLLGALSFIGVGAQPPSAEWGAAVSAAEGQSTTAWWAALAPGLAIAVTSAAFGLLGDRLQSVLDSSQADRG